MIHDCKNEEKKERKKKRKKRNTLETNSKVKKRKRSSFDFHRIRWAKQRPPFRLNVHPELLITCLRYPGRCASDRTSQHPSRPIFIPSLPFFHFSTLLWIFLHFSPQEKGKEREREREEWLMRKLGRKQRPRTIINTLSKNFNFGEIKFLQYPRDK